MHFHPFRTFFIWRVSRRIWLPQPLRKLSQGKVDKPSASVPSSTAASSSSASAAQIALTKKRPEKAFKTTTSVTAEEEQPVKANISHFRDKTNADYHHKSEHDQQQLHQSQPTELENEEEVVLPPPMKPIQDSQVIINNGPTVVDNSPCKRVSIQTTLHFVYLWDISTVIRYKY